MLKLRNQAEINETTSLPHDRDLAVFVEKVYDIIYHKSCFE